jgi:hypothetical protein
MQPGTRPGRRPRLTQLRGPRFAPDFETKHTAGLEILQTPREVSGIELAGMISSVAHLAYHLGAIRQINKTGAGRRKERSDSAD